MRARFTTDIAGLAFGYSAGTEVSVEGSAFGFDVVPEDTGRAWLASGVLEPVAAAMQSAAVRVPETAAFAAARPRHSAVARK